MVNATESPPIKCLRCAIAYLLLVIAYVVSGKLGLMLALPPGYASPIFPPAGIAVAAALIGGRKTLPWIFLGSLLLNIWVGYSSSQQLNIMEVEVATIIAIASMLQAATGSWALRRAIGYPVSLDHSREVLRFLLLAPAICLISASFSVSGLGVLGVIDAASFPTTWAAWWVGDTLGVVVMLPLTMIIAGEPRLLWQSRIRTVAIPMLLVFALFVVIFLKANQWERNDSLTEFRQLSQQVVNLVQNKLGEQEAVLEQTAALFMHDRNGQVTRQEFHRFAERSLNRFPMIQALEWATPVDATHRAIFEATQRKDFPGFEIRERDAAGQLRRAGQRNSFYPVTYIEPLAGNEPAMGFDLSANPERRAALAKAGRSESTVISAVVPLIQQRQEENGVLLLFAVNPRDSKSGTVLTVLRMNVFMDTLLLDTRAMFYTRLIDLDAQKIVYDNFASGADRALYVHAFDFGLRHYRLETAPTPGYYKQHHGWQSWGVLATGILGTGLLGALFLLGTGYTARIEAQVEDRTRKLKESESRFRNTLENAPIGMAIAGLDGRLIQVNHALCTMLGYEKETLEKLMLQDITYPEDMQLTLSMIRQLGAGEIDSYRIEKRYLRKDGQPIWAQLSASIERDDIGRPLYFIGQIEDITERKQLELQLSRRLRHLDVMERITRISLSSATIEELLGKVLDEILDIFEADRAWFLYPCDPDAPSWSVPMERTRPEWPGAFAHGMTLAMTPEVAAAFREVLASDKPLSYGPAASRNIPVEVAAQFSVRSQIQMALRPRVGSPWTMGLHHCAQARAYDEDELLIFRDIGQRVADALSSMIILNSLQESEENLHRAQAIGQIGSWLLDIPVSQMKCSAETYRMLGIPQQEAIDLEAFISAIHPDDRDMVLKAWSEALAGASYDIEHRIVSAGHERWVRERARIERSPQGQPLTGIGTVQDITERKQAEAELRIAATAFESQDGIMITDANSVILRINHAFTEITGYTAKEAVGKTPRLLKSGHHDAAFYATMWQSIQDNGSWMGEIWNRRKSGEVYPEQLTITEVRDEGGRITNYVATLNDITLRKAAEEQIRNLAFYDALTQLPNRRLLNDRLKQMTASNNRSGRYGALMFLDMDNFKPLNDTYGHGVGDLLLLEAASRLRGCVREVDTVARFGGDEFVVMLGELSNDKAESATQARTVAEKIRNALSSPYRLTVKHEGMADAAIIEHRCSASIGMVLFASHPGSPDDILKWADAAMYRAKESGRNQIYFSDENA